MPERWLLIIAGLALVYPKAMLDYIGMALIVVVIASASAENEAGAAKPEAAMTLAT